MVTPNGVQIREISFADLRRFEETLKPPFRRALMAGRVDLLPPPAASADMDDPLVRAVTKARAVYDERGGRLVVPLMVAQKVLGLVVIWQVESGQLHSAVSTFLAAVTEAALDLVRLRVAAETDPVTGLSNEIALNEELTLAVSRLKPARHSRRPSMAPEQPRESLALLSLTPGGIEALRERYGSSYGDAIYREAAQRIKNTVDQPLIIARKDKAFLILLRGGSDTVHRTAKALCNALKEVKPDPMKKRTWSGPLFMGAALMDLEAGGCGLPGPPAEAAAVLKARSLRALACSVEDGMENVLFFSRILDLAGRISEIMPLDRVRINLGRAHGLTDGEYFVVTAAQPGKEDRAKAEIAVVSLGEESSIAEITALLDPTFTLRPGDRLKRLSRDMLEDGDADPEQVLEIAGQSVRVLLDELTGLPSHRSFVSLFGAMCRAEGDRQDFTAGLIRLEGMEGLRELSGVEGAESLLKALAARVSKEMPEGGFLGRFAPDTLSLILPGTAPEKARDFLAPTVKTMADKLKRPVYAGLAGHPCPGFEAGDTLDNAAKALVHAGFLEPGNVVIFDAVSLNISGDELFAQGRIVEAVAEYEKALLIDSSEPNVLNSLGVCYGHLGQSDKALGFFERAKKAAPEDFMAFFNLGYALMSQGKLAEAEEQLTAGLALKPEHADSLFQLGRLAQAQGRLDDALDFFTRASQREDCRKAVHRQLGEALAAAGRLLEAEEAFNRAIKVQPDDAAALSSLAGLYLDRKANLEIALSLAQRACKIEPHAVQHKRILARALFELGRMEEASAVLGAATAGDPEDAFLAVQRAELEMARGDAALARDEFLRALSLEPNLERARKGLAGLEESEPEMERNTANGNKGPETSKASKGKAGKKSRKKNSRKKR